MIFKDLYGFLDLASIKKWVLNHGNCTLILAKLGEKKALLEHTLGRHGIMHMWGFLVSGTCDCRNVVNC